MSRYRSCIWISYRNIKFGKIIKLYSKIKNRLILYIYLVGFCVIVYYYVKMNLQQVKSEYIYNI